MQPVTYHLASLETGVIEPSTFDLEGAIATWKRRYAKRWFACADAVIHADSTWTIRGDGTTGFDRPDGSRGVVHCVDQQERCAIAPIGGADKILPCRTLAWMVSQGKRQFRVDEAFMAKSDKRREAVVIDLVCTRKRSVFAMCDFCPFCGASIKTQFTDADP